MENRSRLSLLHETLLRLLSMAENVVRRIWSVTLGRFIFVKPMGSRDPAVEVATINFIRRNTTIPVPRIFGAVRYRGSQYIFMTRLAGTELSRRRWKAYSQDSRDAIISQLKDYISQIRQIGPPPSSPPFICSILGGPVTDHRLCVDRPYGPYRDEEQMNLQVRQGFSVDEFGKVFNLPQDAVDIVRRSHDIQHPIVFTHNDIAMRNILVDGDCVTGLIDWECSGWFPEHWEYTKACWTDFHAEEWVRDLKGFIPPFDLEYLADDIVGWSRSWEPRLNL
ncbi:kinase-like domain-containing protein [Lentinula raphanica]|uniref:Kinase-like domain-containing protein n=1 Tax=Lentinula raphanica TaxID=153919 RepID=A0AA38P719_9AGAR|nr:kinase-like domain-containing protein [Lentinula raphanica]